MINTDHIRIDPAYSEILRASGLASVQGVLDRTDGRVAAWSRSTETLHVPGVDGAPGFFIKRYYYPTWRKRMRGAFRGAFFGAHRGQAEFRLLNEMRALGLPAVRPIAYGARRTGHFLVACFLVTEEIPGARNLTSFAGDVLSGQITLNGADRALLARRLARQVAELHMARFAHGQLFWRNILIRFNLVNEPEFFFLDVRPRRGGRHFGRAGRWWLHELSHLAASAMPFATRIEKMRFLVEYFGARRLSPDVKCYIHEIERLAERWTTHEGQRIKMNGQFEDWNRRLQAEIVEETLNDEDKPTASAEAIS